MFKALNVVDCSTVLAGPSVGTFFAELGANVIKIEHPQLPDVTRSWKLSSENPSAPASAYFASVNYHKTIHHLNYTNPLDREKLLEFISKADILLSNFKKGDAEKFQLTDDLLKALNPRLIHGKINGFGAHSDRVAYDLILQAETGFMSMNGTAESGPVKMPVALIDVLAAHQLKEGILVALLNRMQSGTGGSIEVSLYDAAICSLMNQASNYLMQNHIPQRIGSLHPNIAPYGEQFTTKDQQLIVFAIGSDKQFNALCAFLELPELSSDEQFSTNVARVKHRKELADLLQSRIKQFTAENLAIEMERLFVPMGIIRDLKSVFDQPTAQKLTRTETVDNQQLTSVQHIAFQFQPWK